MDIDKSRQTAKLIQDLRTITGIQHGYQQPAADLLCVSVWTIKNWVKNGAPELALKCIELMLRSVKSETNK